MSQSSVARLRRKGLIGARDGYRPYSYAESVAYLENTWLTGGPSRGDPRCRPYARHPALNDARLSAINRLSQEATAESKTRAAFASVRYDQMF